MVAVAHPGYALPVRRQSAPGRHRLRVPDAAVPARPGFRPLSAAPQFTARPQRVAPATYARRRLVAAMAATMLAVVAAAPLSSAVRAVAGGVVGASEPASALLDPRGPTHVHVVQPGETFWSIARDLAPAGDPRPVVDRLVARHGSPSLHVGERLVLPGRK